MRILLILLLFSCETQHDKPENGVIELNQQIETNVKLQISSRVDTTNQEVKDVLHLYENYINSNPDSIYNNPYWNTKEKSLYEDFDFSRASIYNGLNSDQLLRIYTPFVLSIEPTKKGKYQIRVMYSNSAVQSLYVGSKVWCILKLNAIRENGKWKLENILLDTTRNWRKKNAGFIEYIFSNDHVFDKKQAEKALRFCNKIIDRFNPTFNERFQFYIAEGVDQMGELENFDYYFTGITTGKAREGMILSSISDEYYPHEFIHKLLPVNEHRGHVIEEGLATFLGTKEDIDEYLLIMKKLANDFNKTASYSLENILNNQTKWNGYQVAYPGGALVCEVIYEIEGDEGINKLAQGKSRGYREIISLTAEILKLAESEVLTLIEGKIKEFE